MYAFTSLLYRGAGFLLFVWLAKSLTVAEYARWGLLYAFQTAVAAFGLVGIIESTSSLLHRYPSPEQRAVLFSAAIDVFLGVAGLSIVIAFIAGIAIQGISGGGVGVWTLTGALSSGALMAYAALRTQIHQLEGRHKEALAFSFLLPSAGLAGSLLATSFEPTAGAFFLGGATCMALAAVICRKLVGGRASGSSRTDVRRMIAARIAPYLAVTLFGWLGGYGNNILVNHFFQPIEVARFTFSLTVASVMQLTATSLNQVWNPRFFAIVRSEPIDSVERRNRRFYGFQSAILGTVGALCLVLLPIATKFLGGNLVAYSEMGTELFFIVVGYVCLSPWWHCANYLVAYDSGPTIMRVSISTSAIGIAIWIALMMTLGEIGIYVGFFVQMLIRSAGIALIARRRWPIQNSWGGVALGILIASAGLILGQNQSLHIW